MRKITEDPNPKCERLRTPLDMSRIRLIATPSGTLSAPLPEADFAISLLRGQIRGDAPVLFDGVVMNAREALMQMSQGRPRSESTPLEQTVTASPRAKMMQP